MRRRGCVAAGGVRAGGARDSRHRQAQERHRGGRGGGAPPLRGYGGHRTTPTGTAWITPSGQRCRRDLRADASARGACVRGVPATAGIGKRRNAIAGGAEAGLRHYGGTGGTAGTPAPVIAAAVAPGRSRPLAVRRRRSAGACSASARLPARARRERPRRRRPRGGAATRSRCACERRCGSGG